MSLTCAQLEDVAAELALGTVSGADRAAALDHLAGCGPCRILVDQLARVADSLLLLAPEAEPPPGFESRVLSKITPAARAGTGRGRRVLVGVAAAALVAALSGAGAAMIDDDRRPADIRTALVSDDQGRWTCRALVYGDDPTWLVVSLDRTDGLTAAFSVEGVSAGSATPVPLGSFSIEQGHGSLAKAIGLPADDLRSVRVLDSSGRVRYEMTFPPR